MADFLSVAVVTYFLMWGFVTLFVGQKKNEMLSKNIVKETVFGIFLHLALLCILFAVFFSIVSLFTLFWPKTGDCIDLGCAAGTFMGILVGFPVALVVTGVAYWKINKLRKEDKSRWYYWHAFNAGIILSFIIKILGIV